MGLLARSHGERLTSDRSPGSHTTDHRGPRCLPDAARQWPRQGLSAQGTEVLTVAGQRRTGPARGRRTFTCFPASGAVRSSRVSQGRCGKQVPWVLPLNPLKRFEFFTGWHGEPLKANGLSLVQIDSHRWLGSGSEKLHAEARRKDNSRRTRPNPLIRSSFFLCLFSAPPRCAFRQRYIRRWVNAGGLLGNA